MKLKHGPINSILLLFICQYTASAEPLKPNEIAKQAFPSVVMLMMEDCNGQPLSLGSGFVIKNNLVATNLHVVEGASSGYAKVVGQKDKYPIKGYVAIDKRMDLILLEVENLTAPSLKLSETQKPEIGDEIFVVGNPKGLEGTFSKGIVSGIRDFEQDKILQITAPISPGSSGGPVLDSNAEVVGIAVATFKGGQNLNFAIPASYVELLSNNTHPIIPVGKKDTSVGDKKSVFASFGKLNTEGVECDNFLWNESYKNDYQRTQGFTFSIKNKIHSSIKDVVVLVVFYDSNNDPIEVSVVGLESTVPKLLARRATGSVDLSIKTLTTHFTDSYGTNFVDHPFTKVEYRVLYFDIFEADEELF